MAMQDGDTCQASAARMTPKMGVYIYIKTNISLYIVFFFVTKSMSIIFTK